MMRTEPAGWTAGIPDRVMHAWTTPLASGTEAPAIPITVAPATADASTPATTTFLMSVSPRDTESVGSSAQRSAQRHGWQNMCADACLAQHMAHAVFICSVDQRDAGLPHR